MDKKICSRCKVEKEYSEFTPRSDRPCAYRSVCKQCDRDYAAKYREENLWKVKISQKNHRIKNREQYLKKKIELENRRMQDPEKRKRKTQMNNEYKKKNNIRNKPPFTIWDDVKYLCHKWRVIAIIPSRWHKIQKYGDLTTIIVGKQHLTKYRIWL